MNPLTNRSLLLRLFTYDPDTGSLFWNRREGVPAWWNTRYAGKRPCATDALGYLRAKITDGAFSGYVSVHRIIWCMVHGDLPDVIDHVNGDVADNRLTNLRASGPRENAWNRKANSGTLTGMKGVKAIRYQKGPSKGQISGYTAYIGHNRRREYLGYFPTPEQAAQAYCDREQQLREEYSRK